MPGKLRERANLRGGQVEGCALVDVATYVIDESVARQPSHYRALAVTMTYNATVRVARTTIGAPGSSVTGDLLIRAPVETAKPIVQKYYADDGTWRRKSTDESSWSGWVPTDRPIAPTGWSIPSNGAGSGKGDFNAATADANETAEQLAALISDLIANGALEA